MAGQHAVRALSALDLQQSVRTQHGCFDGLADAEVDAADDDDDDDNDAGAIDFGISLLQPAFDLSPAFTASLEHAPFGSLQLLARFVAGNSFNLLSADRASFVGRRIGALIISRSFMSG